MKKPRSTYNFYFPVNFRIRNVSPEIENIMWLTTYTNFVSKYISISTGSFDPKNHCLNSMIIVRKYWNIYFHTYPLQITNTEKDSISQSSWQVCDVTDSSVGGRWDRQEAANVSSHVICTIHQITCHGIHNVYYTLLHIISCTRQLKGRTCQKKGKEWTKKGLKIL